MPPTPAAPSTSSPPAMRLLCPAKVNLHLRVGPRRADGFHALLSWMCGVGLFDTLTLQPTPALSTAGVPDPPEGGGTPGRKTAPPGETGKLAGAAAARSPQGGAPAGIRLHLECEPAGLPCDERNLVVRVASAWRTPGPAELDARLIKRIPVGAGLGGGSSDAARMVLALQRLWPGGAGGDLSAFAARFGSDVPFFLAGPSSACAGRGEIVRPIPRPRPGWAVLVLPDLMMPTPDVYRQFDAMGLGRDEDIEREPDWPAWAALDARSLLERLVNDLEPPAFALRPELGELRGELEARLVRIVRMSGSGSSLFTLFDGEAEARESVAVLKQSAVASVARFEAVELAPRIDDDLER